MPINYLAQLTDRARTARTNLHLGLALAFVAGALNAGGFLAIGQYTSHMTGFVSSAADNLILGNLGLVVVAALSLFSFAAGAATTALLVSYSRRKERDNIYAIPLLLEALLLLLFGMIGASLQLREFVSISMTAILLTYVMGLQNALITKVSKAEIRTTHVTGLVTDIGIELGKLIYWNRHSAPLSVTRPIILANRSRLRVHGLLVASFFVGGVAGAFGFKYGGFSATIPLAIALVILSAAPAFRTSASMP